jgi:predicted MFS family arabinose efflux permease
MMAARLLVGVGEAAYGSVGCAVVVSVFPASVRATIVATFTTGGVLGSVIGMALGGAIAQQFGWRWAFAAMGVVGLVLGAVYPVFVKEQKVDGGGRHSGVPATSAGAIGAWRAVFPSRMVAWTYVASGVQLFIPAAMLAWLPSYFNRYYGMAPAKAALTASVLALAGGVGTILCGSLADWLSRKAPRRQLAVAMAYCLATATLMLAAFQLPAGGLQLLLLGLAMTVSSGSFGPSGAAVAAGAQSRSLGSVFGTLTLTNSLFGLATGPFLIGVLADRVGLLGALRLAPLAGLIAGTLFLIAFRAGRGRAPAEAGAGRA